MKKILLDGDKGKGRYFFIDDVDFNLVSKHKWFLGTGDYPLGHIQKNLIRKNLYPHSLIMNPPIGMQVDHINGDKFDNRRSNLRIVTREQNQMNRRKVTIGSSIFKGVSWHKGTKKWTTQIKKDGVGITIGYFNKEHYAAMAYDLWARDLFGEYAKLNFERN